MRVPDHLNEVIEIVVQQMILEESGEGSFPNPLRESVGAKLLAKILELIDEILKNHCEHLAMNGIYTVSDMLHLLPCPLCYGDSDHRTVVGGDETDGKKAETTPRSLRRAATTQQKNVRNRPDRALSRSVNLPTVADDRANALYAFRVDECIEQTVVSDSMSCPRHGQLEIAHLAPDIVRNCVPAMSVC